MPRIIRAPQAEEDLFEIGLYIARDNPVAADRLLDTIEQKLDLLARQPMVGSDCSYLAEGLRRFPIGNYVVYYRPFPDGIEVVRVLHGARDADSLFQA